MLPIPVPWSVQKTPSYPKLGRLCLEGLQRVPVCMGTLSLYVHQDIDIQVIV